MKVCKPKFKCENVEPDPKNPWGDDVLGRKAQAPILTEAIKYEDCPFVISVSGAWGCGKTFFLRRWAAELRLKKWNVVYFNAWEDDGLEDPLLAFVGQLASSFRSGALKTMVRAVVRASVPVVTKVGLSILNAFLQRLTGVELKMTKEELMSALEKAGCDYVKHKACEKALKQKIAEFADRCHEESKHPLVIIVDELDRCRPLFALNALERLKHLFSVRHVVFVLGMDREQLGHTIRAALGNLDVNNYLLRIIDMDMRLPDADCSRYFEHHWERLGMGDFAKGIGDFGFSLQEAHDVRHSFALLCKQHNLTLREIEYAIRIMGIAIRQLEHFNGIWPLAVVVVVFLSIRNPVLLDRLLHGTASVRELVDFMYPEEPDKSVVAAIYAVCGPKSPDQYRDKPVALRKWAKTEWAAFKRSVAIYRKNFTKQSCYEPNSFAEVHRMLRTFSPFSRGA